jgi:hypothetical protein
MPMNANQLSQARKVFGVIFVISLLSFIVTLVLTGAIIENIFSLINNSLGNGPAGLPNQPVDSQTKLATFTLYTTFITAGTSLIGFVSTLVLGWRKDKREASLAELERKRMEIELEKQRLELDKLRKNKNR